MLLVARDCCPGESGPVLTASSGFVERIKGKERDKVQAQEWAGPRGRTSSSMNAGCFATRRDSTDAHSYLIDPL
jgi:hypothetical protein